MNGYESQLLELTRPAADQLVEAGEEEEVRCFSCGHKCSIKAGGYGVCHMRKNVGGELRVPFGYVSSMSVDPMEKKPFFHALPGQGALSYGMLGCNFSCPYCQNWNISQTLRDSNARVEPRQVSADRIVDRALKSGVDCVVSTYNEPLITSEWNRAVFERAKDEGLITGYVSNGYASERVLEYIQGVTDLFNVDFKAFSSDSYRKLGGDAQEMRENIRRIYRRGFHLEVITLIVPGQTDDEEEIERMAEFLVSVSPDIPWHLTAFRGAYKWRSHSSTRPATLRMAYETAREAGMNHVYCGNLPGQVDGAENTTCPDCGEVLIKRLGYSIEDINLRGDECPACSRKIYGRFEV